MSPTCCFRAGRTRRT